jgi:predicted SAM-dependent methyltransferase
MKKYLNLGCGKRYCKKNWVNLDFVSISPSVKKHNLLKGIPYPDNSFELVYHSHVLEHFTQAEGRQFIKECYRVLKPGGVIRVVVPDLEQIARMYLEALSKARKGSKKWKANYEWMLLELLDQMSRNQSGGEMAKYLLNRDTSNKDFLIKRCGQEIENTIKESKNKPYLVKLKLKVRDFFHFLLKGKLDFLETGYFRHQGEVHQWMYDSFSLSQLLKEAGFIKIKKRCATSSYNKKWKTFNLDTDYKGVVFKPDSLYMEAIRP